MSATDSGKTPNKWRKRTIIALVGVAVLGAGGIAYAFWTGTGSGTGTASTATSVGITVNQLTAPAGLTPGGPADPLSGDFDNTTSAQVHVNNVVVSIDPAFSESADGTKNACTAADFTLVQPTPVDTTIPIGTGVGSWGGGSIQMNNLDSNQDNCKGVTVPLVYTTT